MSTPEVRAVGARPSRGTTLAFRIAVIGLTLSETVTLRKVFRPRLTAAFGSVGGFAFNALL